MLIPTHYDTMKKYVYLTLFVLFYHAGFSQQIKLSATKPDGKIISTGAMYERIKLPPAYFDKFTENNTTFAKNSAQWISLYHAVYQADFKHKLLHFFDLKKQVKSDLSQHVFHIGILNYQYNKIKDDAWQNNKVRIRGKILIVNDKTAIETKNLFAVAPIMMQKNTGEKVHFDFSNRYYFSNISDRVLYYQVNFDDGLGIRKIYSNQRVQIQYANEGIKHVRVQAVTQSGAHFSSGFNFTVRRIAMPTPDETWSNYTADIAYNGATAQGEVAVFFGAGNSDFTRPVIVSDGFDPGDIRDLSEIYDIVNQQNMVDVLRAQGYDLILLNFSGGDDYIQRNAMLLKKLIEDINTRMQASGTMKPANQIVVVGPSMSGLVSRYALDYMEQHNIPHNVRNWIAFDSPQKGANVPLGLQHWLRFYAEVADVAGAQTALETLKGAAAKQMLTYYYTATNKSAHLAGHDALYDTFYNEINAMGFPQQTRIVSIINGSGYGNGQPYNPGQQTIKYRYRSLLVDLDGNVWAIPNHTDTKIFFGVYDVIGWWNYEEENVYVNNTAPLDSAPGGTRDTFQELADTDTDGHGDIIAYYPSHAFIPSVSSLCIQNTNDPYYNVNANIGSVQTPFDKLYYPNTNQAHIAITNQSLEWFKHEIINYAPQFTSTPDTEIDAGSLYSYTLTANDINEWNVLNFTAVSLPSWLSYDPQTHRLQGTPDDEDIGTYSVTLKVDDGLDEITQNFTIEVFPKCTHAPITEWDGSNWSAGMPDTSHLIVINADYNTQSNGSINACSLQVAQGKTLEVAQDFPVSVERNVTNDGSIIVKDKASFVQTSDKAQISGNGVFRVEKSVDNLNHYYNMVYWSSPIQEGNFTAGDLLPNAWRYYSFNPDTQSWMFEQNNLIFQTGKGYVVSAPTGFTGGNMDFVFQKNHDAFNNGLISVPLVVNGAGAQDDDDWNLLGNPYPSAIDFNQLIMDNPNLQGSYYLWTNCAGLNGNNQQEAGYTVYSIGGSTSACQNSGFTATRYIASGQGFFIEANASGMVNFSNAYRVGLYNDNFASRNATLDRIWLDLTDANGNFQQILIGFSDEASDGPDRLFDAKAMDNGSGLNFYSLIDDKHFGIQFASGLQHSDRIIPLGYYLQNTSIQACHIHIDRVEGMLVQKNIYLIDNLLDVTHDLKQSDYIFDGNSAQSDSRFELLIGEAVQNILHTFAGKLSIYQQGDWLWIKSLNNKKLDAVKLFDLSGKEIYTKHHLSEMQIRINAKSLHHKLIICKVFTQDNETFVKKLVVE